MRPGTTRWIFGAIAAFVLVASPVIIYNIQLYRSFGHFYFQFSLFFGQDVAEWQSRPGQETLGSYSNRIGHYLPWLLEANSPYFLLLAGFGLVGAAVAASRRRISRVKSAQRAINSEQAAGGGRKYPRLITGHWFLLAVFSWLLPFFVFVGPAYRFLTIFTPWLALAAAYALVALRDRLARSSCNLGRALIATVFLIELGYSVNTLFLSAPWGAKPFAYGNLHHEAAAWGYNQLESFMAGELKGKMPEVAITFDHPFAKEILNRAAKAGRTEGLAPMPWGIVYDGGINPSAELWIFLRRITYAGWPIVDDEHWQSGGQEFFKEIGVKKMYAVNALEGTLRGKGITPREIQNLRGEVAFRVYEFELQ